jgi:uncharacterized protein (TIGR00369 family)
MTTLATPPAQDVPEGFRLVELNSAFVSLVGPLYAKWADERLLVGFRAEERHGNTMGTCHGGMLAGLADMVMPLGVLYQMKGERRFTPTVSITIDYLAPGRIGQWIQGEVEILRESRRLIFCQGLIRADGVPAARFSGVYTFADLRGDGRDDDPFRLKQPAGAHRIQTGNPTSSPIGNSTSKSNREINTRRLT